MFLNIYEKKQPTQQALRNKLIKVRNIEAQRGELQGKKKVAYFWHTTQTQKRRKISFSFLFTVLYILSELFSFLFSFFIFNLMIHQCRDGKFNFPSHSTPFFITFTSGSIPHNNSRNDNTYTHILLYIEKRTKNNNNNRKRITSIDRWGVTRQKDDDGKKQNSIIQIPCFSAVDNNSIEPKALRIFAQSLSCVCFFVFGFTERQQCQQSTKQVEKKK